MLVNYAHRNDSLLISSFPNSYQITFSVYIKHQVSSQAPCALARYQRGSQAREAGESLISRVFPNSRVSSGLIHRQRHSDHIKPPTCCCGCETIRFASPETTELVQHLQGYFLFNDIRFVLNQY